MYIIFHPVELSGPFRSEKKGELIMCNQSNVLTAEQKQARMIAVSKELSIVSVSLREERSPETDSILTLSTIRNNNCPEKVISITVNGNEIELNIDQFEELKNHIEHILHQYNLTKIRSDFKVMRQEQ